MYFFACTNYHILVSLMVKNHFRNRGEMVLIISDRIMDAQVIYDRTVAEGLWDKVILFESKVMECKRSFFGLEQLFNLVLLKYKVEKLIRNEKIVRICTFTVCDQASNFFSASDQPLDTYLCEDGMYPYYGGIEFFDDSRSSSREKSRSGPKQISWSLKKLIKYFLDKTFLSGIVVTSGAWFDKTLLLNSDLYNDSCDSRYYTVEQLNCERSRTESDFSAMSNIFDYKSTDVYKDIDVVFIDSGMVSNEYLSMKAQVDLTFKLLSRFGSKSLVWKLGPYCDQEKIDYVCLRCSEKANISVDMENRSVPWEVIFFNNKDTLSYVNLATYMSTAAFSPSFFFGVKTDITILSKLVTEGTEMSVLYRSLHDNYCIFGKSIRKYYPDNVIDIPEI